MKSILSIQSHVVYGYVGNKAATFPLQSMGYDVCPINTVQFSNHPGYGKFQGEVFSIEHIKSLIKGIEDLGVVGSCCAVLSGYMGSGEICHEVLETVRRFKKENSAILYLCDPVIGDGKCYVKPEVLEFFKSNLSADIITPNQFEAEILSGIKINSLHDLKNAANYFHERNIKVVIITGVKAQGLGQPGLHLFISYDRKYYVIKTKEYDFDQLPSGAGDLFSALFLGCYLRSSDCLDALKKAVYFIDLVMHNTYQERSKELMVTTVDYRAFDEKLLPKAVSL